MQNYIPFPPNLYGIIYTEETTNALTTSSAEHLFLDNKIISIVSSLIVLCCMICIAKIEEYLDRMHEQSKIKDNQKILSQINDIL